MQNMSPIDWHSKKKYTVDTATHVSECSSVQTCVEQILDLHITLRFLGVPIRKLSCMFGDNDSALNSSMAP